MRLPLLFLSALTLPAPAQDTSLVRDSDPLPPEAELAKLRVPDGFEVRLFAAEPMVNKPINLAFDNKGRLWVSSTVEYPYAAPRERWVDEQGTRVRDSRDAILILEDTDHDGRADKRTVFADGLNIPTGVLPYKNGCIAWSVPNIWFFADNDGDGVCDERRILFGPLGYDKDVHGNCSSFRLSDDGWVYGTHGFSNTSHFRVRPENLHGARPGDPGTEMEVNSGNVYRFRPDGSRVELFTAGQVNPFGLAWDAYGDLYSADCHSAPIYQLLRGAVYPSFGKPHDGLGFGPVMCEHTHGSTGICGLVYLHSGTWGRGWDDHMFVGNVVTSRVNHDRIEFRGATPVAVEQPDFLVSDDPWFRPVDLRLGPDNALWVADFYNRIIGHYEVARDHPGRDRERGRIWRVVKKDAPSTPPPPTPDPVAETVRNLRRQIDAGAHREQVSAALDSPAPRIRLAAAQVAQFQPDTAWLPGLVRLLAGTPASDTHLRHVVRMALRANLRQPGAFPALSAMDLTDAAQRDITEIARTIDTPDAAAAVFAALQKDPGDEAQLLESIRYIARNPGTVSTAALADFVRTRTPHDLDLQAGILTAMHEGLAQRGLEPDADLRHWAEQTASALTDLLTGPPADSWQSLPNPGFPPSASPWVLQPRSSTDGQAATFLSSLDGGGGEPEGRTGILRSPAFARPATLAFWLCGHRGYPDQPAHERNLVRLVDDATGAVLFTSFPPRNDTAQLVQWSPVPGGPVRVEIVDGDTGDAYAWLAVGRFEPALIRVDDFRAGSVPARRAIQLAGLAPLVPAESILPGLIRLLKTEYLDDSARKAAAGAVLDALPRLADPSGIPAGARTLLRFVAAPGLTREAWQAALAVSPADPAPLFRTLPSSRQEALAAAYAAEKPAAEALVRLVTAGTVPARVLTFPTVAQKLTAHGLDTSALTRSLPPLSDTADKLIRERLSALTSHPPDAGERAQGSRLFAAHCALCHRIGATGNLVGPQLDGIGKRGPERIMEDVLDPNRNVDAAFRTHVLTLKSGEVKAGLIRRREGESVILADATGQESPVPAARIATDAESPLSLMPAAFGEAMPESDFLALVAWLLEQ